MSRSFKFAVLSICTLLLYQCSPLSIFAQSNSTSNRSSSDSIGGKEHESNIYGVELGMDVPTALRMVFENANRKPGDEKPDALKREGKGQKDVRVLFSTLPKGELQIVFSEGKFVKEILLFYKDERLVDDLRLPYSSGIGNSTISDTAPMRATVQNSGLIDKSIEEFSASKIGTVDDQTAKRIGNVERNDGDLIKGGRFDDRYTVGFTDNLRQQRIWWRDEKTDRDFRVRVAFAGKKLTDSGGKFVASIVQKTITITPNDEKAFDAYFQNKGKQ